MSKHVKRIGGRGALVSLFAAGLVCLPFAGAASAQADPCDISNFIGTDGSIDLTSYAACVAGAGDSRGDGAVGGGALARTGSDVGGLVGIGSGLIALGTAAVLGARRQTANASAPG